MRSMTYVIDEKRFESNFNKYRRNRGLVYPLKTNDSFEIINLVKKYFGSEDYYLISSKGHYSALKFCGIPEDKMIYTNVCSSFETLEEFYYLGIRNFMFGDFNTLRRFLYKHMGASIGLRLSLYEFTDSASRLGMTISDFEKSVDLLEVMHLSYGVQVYLDRGIQDVDTVVKNVKEYICKFNNITFLNYGGVDVDLGIATVSRYEIGDNLLKGVVDCEVNVEKLVNGILYVNTGIYAGLLDKILYNKSFDISVDNQVLPKKKSDNYSISLDILGSVCDTKDIIGRYYVNNYILDCISLSKKITVLDTGAYCDVFRTRYADDIFVTYIRK